MRIGISSYCFAATYETGKFDVLDLIEWVSKANVTHLEIAAYRLGHDLTKEPDVVREIAARAKERKVNIAAYAVDADFLTSDPEAAFDHIRSEINVAERLGIKLLRHDLARWTWSPANEAEYTDALARVVPYVQRLADYAAPKGITTLVENHGHCFNGPERMLGIHAAVRRDNFGFVVDVGNFLTVDADPLTSFVRCLPHARLLHLKDFSIRATQGDGEWQKTARGRFIKGRPLGDGDMPVAEILRTASDYRGPVTFEIDGPEDDMEAVTRSLAYVAGLTV
jgi:inosose dehydratase